MQREHTRLVRLQLFPLRESECQKKQQGESLSAWLKVWA